MSTFREDFHDWIQFIRHPSGSLHHARRSLTYPADTAKADFFGFSWQALHLWKWVAVLLLINTVFALLLSSLVISKTGAMPRMDIIQSMPPLFFLLLATVFAPILEELIFRYPLRRPQIARWYWPIVLVMLFITHELWIKVAICAFLLLAAYYYRSEPRIGWRNAYKWKRLYPWIFHLSILMFALLHLGNYALSTQDHNLFLLPLLVVPQWIAGSVLAWVRVRHGIGASILMHAMYNFVPVIVAILGILILHSHG